MSNYWEAKLIIICILLIVVGFGFVWFWWALIPSKETQKEDLRKKVYLFNNWHQWMFENVKALKKKKCKTRKQ